MEPFLYEPLDGSSFKKSELASMKNAKPQADASEDLNGFLDELVTSFVKTSKGRLG